MESTHRERRCVFLRLVVTIRWCDDEFSLLLAIEALMDPQAPTSSIMHYNIIFDRKSINNYKR